MVYLDPVGIARALHDGIAQDLVALGYSIDLLIATPQTPIQTRVELRTMRFRVDELITKVRQEIFQLRQSVETEALGDTSGQLLVIAKAICGDRMGEINLSPVTLSFEAHQIIISTATELLRNSYVHSRGTQIDLTLTSIEDRTTLVVADNGIGGAHMSSTRFGLRGISERVAMLDGEFILESNANGTRAHIAL